MKRVLSIGIFLFVLAIAGFAQEKVKVEGTVTDASDNSTLPGVTVLQKGTSTGTVTTLDGHYQLTVDKGAVLSFSFVGYKTREIKIEKAGTYDVALHTDNELLKEVLVIGYGVQKKEDKTGAIAHIDAKELPEGVISSPVQSLQGKLAGVSVTKQGGDPNGGFSVKIRGASGLFSGTSPMYVIDGVLGADPNSIAPEDIASFTVLKDASATAIYGSRGANGIIEITTKSGKAGKKENHISLNTYYSMDRVKKRFDRLSAAEYRDYVQKYGLESSFLDGGADTDWQDEVYRKGLSHSINLLASGSNENASYSVSITNRGFNGVLNGSSRKMTLGRMNVVQKGIHNKLTLSATINGAVENNDYIQYGGSGPNDVIYQMLQRNPTDPVRDENGDFVENVRDFNYYNPVALINQIQNFHTARKFTGNLFLEYEILPGMKAKINGSYMRNIDDNVYFEPTFARGGVLGSGNRRYNDYSMKLIETTLSYHRDIDSHHLGFIGGYSWQEAVNEGFRAGGTKPVSDYIGADNLMVFSEVKPGDIGSWKSAGLLISMFGRMTYDYASKYYLTATMRYDGSTKFGENNEWGFFPSFSAGWTISNEDFLKDNNIVSFLKLRAGYGKTGNQEFADYLDVLYYSPGGVTINPETQEPVVTFYPNHNANPNLKWEENRELNVGLDFGFFKDRINGSLEYYDKLTYDLLAPYAVPQPPNISSTTWANAGSISNRGWEALIQTYPVNGSFKWKTSLTFTKNMMKLVSLSSEDGTWTWSENDKHQGYVSGRGMTSVYSQELMEDEELGSFYMPEYAGLSEDGKFLFYTAAGGVTRNYEDAEKRVVGHALPDFELGWSNMISYGPFDLNFNFRWVQGFQVLNVTRMIFSNPNNMPNLNQLRSVIDEKERGLTDIPKLSSYYLEDASFVKLDNITLGMNIPVPARWYIRKLRAYVSSNNVLTLTKYSGIDPEISHDGLSFGIDMYNVYPKVRTFTLGLNVGF